MCTKPHKQTAVIGSNIFHTQKKQKTKKTQTILTRLQTDHI